MSQPMDLDDIADTAATSSKNDSAPPPSSPASTEVQSSQSTSTAARFKYKYPQAYPTPDGEDDEMWNKLYTAADSRLYNKHGKNANESKKYRLSGETRTLALQMLQEKKAKLAATGASTKPSTPKPAPKKPVIKQESSISSRDVTPALDRMNTMSISEKIKSGGRARKASSVGPSDHGSTTLPTASAQMGSPAPPGPKIEKPKKKGTAAPMKKRGLKPKSVEDKTDDPSNSAGQRTGPSSDDESNDGGEYCICGGPDDHRMMVYCEGGCNDWYHCSCVKLNEADAKELLDRFICPKCKNDKQTTTWKRYCRYGNIGKFTKDPNACRLAARVSDNPPSKYCSDEHREEFWKWVSKNLTRKENQPAIPGGRLSAGEVGWIMTQVQSVTELHALGQKPKLPTKEGADPNHHPGLDYLTDEEIELLSKITLRLASIDTEVLLYKNKELLRQMIVTRSEKAASHLSVKPKDICGYDSRLACNQLSFSLWSNTTEGQTALSTGTLGPRTPETRILDQHIPIPGQDIPNPNHGQGEAEKERDEEVKDICLKKKCIKHKDWAATMKSDIANALYLLVLERRRLGGRKEELLGEAETTEALRVEYEDNVTVKLF